MQNKAVKTAAPSLPTTPDMLYDVLERIEITYKLYEHAPIFTVEEGEHLKADIPGVHCRNLFLRDKKKRMFLVVAANETAIDLKKLQDILDCGRLSFGSADRLFEYLGITPGSVCPFCAINDKDHAVQVVLDQSMMDAQLVNYHPLDNSKTIGLSPGDLLKFFGFTGHETRIIDLTKAAPDV